ncbi:MAG: carboxypeptidase regulatory-like domain-containing protein [Bryobacterales bacterium]|nr:carboxypeptidase regulatory-like domain-containing protein [Bryobacterales bacterium]
MRRYIGLFIPLLFPCALAAQDYRAKIQGLITDSSNAALPTAKVWLRNQNTGIEATRAAGPTGSYIFDFVEPGTYTLTAEYPGFSRTTQRDIPVQTRADVTVNLTLNPGQVADSVTVTDAAPQLQFNSSTRELTIDRKMLSELPVKQRNPFSLALLDPAVVNRYGSERNPFFMWSSSSIDVGGSTNRKNDLLLDGAPLQLNQKGSYAPPMDAVQEFSVQQNSVDAEFGHSAGGVLSLSIKSGTNTIKGSAYYFGRNPAFNAVTNSYTRPRVANLIRNHIGGGSMGAPIKKNKIFNFASYELWRTREPRNTVRTMPTDLERTGDFSKSLNQFGTLRTIYDPWTSRLNVANNTGTRQPIPGNVIPASRIDATAARFMKDIWGPNGPGDNVTGVNNFRTNYTWLLENWNFNNRTDWNINDKWKFFARYSQLKTNLDQGNYTPNNSPAMPNDNGGIMNSRNIAGDVVWTKSARTVVNFRGSFASLEDDYNAPAAAVGEAGLAQFWANDAWYKPYLEGIPAIYYPNLTFAGNTLGKSSYWIQHPRSYNFSGKVSQMLGKHYVKYGGESRHSRSDGVFPNLMTFNFPAGLTAATFINTDTRSSGDTYATFLLGALDTSSAARFVAPQNINMEYFGAFLHDDFKISRRLTLNLGVRYEYSTPPVDTENRYSRYLDLKTPIAEFQQKPPVIPADILALRTAAPIYNGSWVFTDDKNRGVFQTQKLILMPRLGLAYRANDKTAIQVGFARYVVPPNLQTLTIERINFPGFSASTTPLGTIEGVPQAVLSRPFPPDRNPLQAAVGKGYGKYTNLGNAASWDYQNFEPQVNDRINFTIQRQLPANFKLDATYFFNIGRHLPYSRSLNLTDPRLGYTYKAQLNVNVPNPFYNILPLAQFPGSQRNPLQVSRASLLRPYPQYGALTETGTPGPRNRYQALQLRLQRTYRSGASFLFSFNRNYERTEGFFNADHEYDQQWSWIPTTNPRNRANLSGSYDLPVGRGRRYAARMNRAADAIVGGWSMHGLMSYSSGTFLRFGNLKLLGDPHIDNPGPNAWFNTAAFGLAEAFTPRLNPLQYQDITGPSTWNLDATLAKTFSLTERYKLELRLEAYNAPNAFMWNDPALGLGSTFGRSTNQSNRGREVQYTLRLQF